MRPGLPDAALFPFAAWRRLLSGELRAAAVGRGAPIGSAGLLSLRAAIARHVAVSRGVRASAEDVLVTTGGQQAMDLLGRVLLAPGDVVAVEDPGYLPAHRAFIGQGAVAVGVAVDAEGLVVEALPESAKLVYVTPSHQFPLGAVMSAARRLALLAWARRANASVVEDDYDSEFRYTGRPLPCLQGLEAEQRASGEPARVLYTGTFSKTLVPGLRMAYLVVPDALVDAVRAARAAADRYAPTFTQGVLADFIGEGHYARYVRSVRALYADRQAALLAAAAEAELHGLLTLAPDPAGLHLVGWLPPGVVDTTAAEAGGAEGVDVAALSRFALTPSSLSGRGALLLGYAAFDVSAIRTGVRRLRRALDAVHPTYPRSSRR
jgi:GntR family transcriptional regulator / MocR family aminotransferase